MISIHVYTYMYCTVTTLSCKSWSFCPQAWQHWPYYMFVSTPHKLYVACRILRFAVHLLDLWVKVVSFCLYLLHLDESWGTKCRSCCIDNVTDVLASWVATSRCNLRAPLTLSSQQSAWTKLKLNGSCQFAKRFTHDIYLFASKQIDELFI